MMLVAEFFPDTFWFSVVSTCIYGFIGIAFVLLAVGLFDKVSIAKVSLHDELKNGNMAVAVVLASLILGICLLVTHLTG
jgi:uncharacterized membrane protein YjfL (UPF0719 family)